MSERVARADYAVAQSSLKTRLVTFLRPKCDNWCDESRKRHKTLTKPSHNCQLSLATLTVTGNFTETANAIRCRR